MNSTYTIDNSHKLSNLSVFKILQILSIDVVLGSICSGYMVIRLIGYTPGIAWWFILPLSVWLVYTVDHLSDGLRLAYKAQTIRHLYHYKYRKIFIVLIITFGIITAIAAFFLLNNKIVLFGILLGGFVLIYLIVNNLTLNKKPWYFPKELFIAVLYSIGIWGGPLALADYKTVPANWLALILFCQVAFSNLVIFSYYELENDMNNKHYSIVQFLGKKITTYVVYINQLIGLLITMYTILFLPLELVQIISILIIFTMHVILFFVFYFRTFFVKNQWYRLIGDAVFILPILLLFL